MTRNEREVRGKSTCGVKLEYKNERKKIKEYEN